MAKVKAPLLSLGATGKLAKTLVFSTWKGIKTAREYVVPANPQTAAQTAQRTLFSAMVTSWRTYFVLPAMRTAWNLAAQVGSKTQSGFNAAISAMVQIASGDPNASFCTVLTEVTGHMLFTMINVDDGATGDEAGNFEVWKGSAADALLLADAESTISGGGLDYTATGGSGDVVYFQIRKDGHPRSGIVAYTLD